MKGEWTETSVEFVIVKLSYMVYESTVRAAMMFDLERVALSRRQKSEEVKMLRFHWQ